jgi:hypothetical protein
MFRSLLEPDQRGVSDCSDDVWLDVHGTGRLPRGN